MSGPDFLYRLLPAFLRYRDAKLRDRDAKLGDRDAKQGEPLRALMAVLESQFRLLQKDVETLYDNWFIETCEPWVVPYIGDLLGVRGLADSKHFVFSQRTQVANTIAYRRRKGTATTLARVAQDATGWYAHAVPGVDSLALTYSLRHPRPVLRRTLDLRDEEALDDPRSPFSLLARTADLRGPAPGIDGGVAAVAPGGPGLAGLSTLAVHLWRLQAYPVERAAARRVRDLGGLPCYTFSPFGDDRPLFNPPRTPASLHAPVSGEGVPGGLRRRPLAAEVDSRRRGRPAATDFLGFPPAFQVFLRRYGDVEPRAVPAEALLVCDLSRGAPARSLWSYRQVLPEGGAVTRRVEAMVDPETGRLALPAKGEVESVEVSYSYAFSSDVGGGPYGRRGSLTEPDSETWRAVVSSQTTDERMTAVSAAGPERDAAGREIPLYHDLPSALAGWSSALAAWRPEEEAPAPRKALIRVLDNALYELDEQVVVELRPEGAEQLAIEAADDRCPCLVFRQGLALRGLSDGSSQRNERLLVRLNGLWIEGPVTLEGDLDVEILHCTLRPEAGRDSVAAAGDVRGARLVLVSSIAGALRLPRVLEGIEVRDSILDAGSGRAVTADGEEAYGPVATLERCTIFGSVCVERLALAENVLFTAPVTVRQHWLGELRSCYIPGGSRTPAGVRCATADCGSPAFVSERFGAPGYAQLARHCPREIATGGTDGSEMGVFHHLFQPYREARLPTTLAEYVPWGFEPRIVYVT